MKAKRILAGLAGAVIAATMMVSAAAPAFAATTYTPVAGTSTTFSKFLVMDAGDSVPNSTFSFTVTPGQARSADTSDNAVMQVLPGIGTPTIADVTFGPSDTTSTTTTGKIDLLRTNDNRVTGGAATDDLVHFDSGEKFAEKTATVSFTGITFDEPGIYRYIITETADAAHAAAGIAHDTDVDRVLDVYVTDDNGTLVVSSYVLHTNDSDVVINNTMGSGDVQQAAAALTDKTDGFTNEYASKDLVFKKEVTGNQASRDKWFEFTATLADVADDDVFVVSLAADNDDNTTDGNADDTSGTTSATRASNQGKTNPTSVTGAQLKAGVKFYLQHGQSIAIRGIAPNATYTVEEDEEDYKDNGNILTGYTDARTGVIGTIAGDNKAVKTSFQNERTGVIPTGVMMTVVPAIVLIGAACTAFALKRKNRREDEE